MHTSRNRELTFFEANPLPCEMALPDADSSYSTILSNSDYSEPQFPWKPGRKMSKRSGRFQLSQQLYQSSQLWAEVGKGALGSYPTPGTGKWVQGAWAPLTPTIILRSLGQSREYNVRNSSATSAEPHPLTKPHPLTEPTPHPLCLDLPHLFSLVPPAFQSAGPSGAGGLS